MPMLFVAAALCVAAGYFTLTFYDLFALRTIGRSDVLLVVSVKPYVRQTIEAAKFAKERNARIVAVTDSVLSPLARLAQTAILARTDSPSFFHAVAPAFAACAVCTSRQ